MKNKKAKKSKGRSTTGKQDDTTATTSNRPIFFHMPDDAYGELCQWYRCSFTVSKSQISSLIQRPTIVEEGDDDADPDGTITFNCAEQFMMYCKAGRFGDRQTQGWVLESTSPKLQKSLGKIVVGFTDESWDEVKSDVVVAGNVAKFGQDVELRRKLLATGDRLLVEAAARDRVWGIGYSAKNAMSNRDDWGENRLGKALMQAREQLRKEEQQEEKEEEEPDGES